MAYSVINYVGDGTNKQLAINFTLGYLEESHIHAYIGEAQTEVPVTFVNAGLVTVGVVAVGEPIMIRRIVPVDRLQHDFNNGALLIEQNLDESHLQTLMVAHEVVDGFRDPSFLYRSNQNLAGNRIVGLGDAQDPQDAATLKQLVDGDEAERLYADSKIASNDANLADTIVNVGLTDDNVVITNADVIKTNADVVSTNAGVASIQGSIDLTNADVLLTHADVVSTNADVQEVISIIDTLGEVQAVALNLTDLRSKDNTKGTNVYLSGYTTEGDYGHGNFVWDSSNLAAEVTADTRSAIYVASSTDPTGATGAWVRQYSGALHLGWFDVDHTGASNIDVAIKAAVDYMAISGGTLYIPEGTYLIKHVDVLTNAQSDLTFKGAGIELTKFIFDVSGGRTIQAGYPDATFARNNSSDGMFFISSETSNTTDDTLAVTNIKFRDITFDMQVVTNGFDELMHCISAYGVSKLDVQYCNFVGFLGDGVAVNRGDGVYTNAYNGNIVIRNNTFDGVNQDNRNAVSIYYAAIFDVSNNIITNCTRSDMPGAIDIEPDTSANRTTGGLISYNHISNIGGNVGAISVLTKDTTTATYTTDGIRIIGNYLEAVGTPFAFITDTGGGFDPTLYVGYNYVAAYSLSPFLVRNTNNVLFEENTWNDGSHAAQSVCVEGASRIKVKGGKFTGMVAPEGILVDSASSEFTLDGVSFYGMSGKAATIQYTNSSITVVNNKFLHTLTAGKPIITGLLTMPTAEYTRFSNNVSSGLFEDYNEKEKLLLLTSTGVYPSTYDALLPSQYPYGTTEFYSVGPSPDGFLGSNHGLVVTNRTKYDGSWSIIQRYVVRDHTIDREYVRASLDGSTWNAWKTIAWSVI